MHPGIGLFYVEEDLRTSRFIGVLDNIQQKITDKDVHRPVSFSLFELLDNSGNLVFGNLSENLTANSHYRGKPATTNTTDCFKGEFAIFRNTTKLEVQLFPQFINQNLATLQITGGSQTDLDVMLTRFCELEEMIERYNTPNRCKGDIEKV
jgi:hypothetical protein